MKVDMWVNDGDKHCELVMEDRSDGKLDVVISGDAELLVSAMKFFDRDEIPLGDMSFNGQKLP